MDTVLGLSLTPGAAEVVAVDGREARGSVVYQTLLDTPAAGGAAAVEVAGEVVEAVLQARAETAERDRQVHALGVTWTDDAATTAALVLEKLTRAGVANVVAVRFAQATEAAPGQQAVGAAREATRNTAFPHVTAVDMARRPVAQTRPTPQSLQYAGAAATLVVGALTFVVSLSLAVSLQNTPEREVGPIERVATTTEPTVERSVSPPPEPTVAPVDVHEPAQPEAPAPLAPEDSEMPEELDEPAPAPEEQAFEPAAPEEGADQPLPPPVEPEQPAE
ncbi:MAG TPA: hypothetical protein VK069_11485 [Mycolicibacillus parakoreensis]|nr:hypothetical protein [Mycolicibacillus parakoreensis]